MKSLREILPRCSQSFLDANSHSIIPTVAEAQKNALQPVVATRRGEMNKTEESYSRVLNAMKARGEILSWDFQGMTLRWLCGDKTIKYTADFVVRFPFVVTHLYTIPKIRLIEIKGGYSKMPGYLERAVERFRHAKTYWGEVFQMELHQKTKEGWKQLI